MGGDGVAVVIGEGDRHLVVVDTHLVGVDAVDFVGASEEPGDGVSRALGVEVLDVSRLKLLGRPVMRA